MPKKTPLLRSKWPRVRRVAVHGNVRYLVDARPTGRREYWDSADDALASAERIARQRANDGASSFAELSPAERRDAAEALALLEGEGTLLDAARAFVRETERQRSLAHIPTVDAALDQYLAAKRAELARGELSPLTVEELTSKMRIVRAAFGVQVVSDMTEEGIQTFLHGLPHRPAGKRNIKVKLGQFLRYCVKRKWLVSNPAANIVVKVRAHDVQILDIDQVRRLLNYSAAAGPAPGVFPYHALQLFAGLRPHEARQMRWEHIHFETRQIEVRAATSKTRQTRFVPMISPIVEILLPYRRPSGPIVGPRFRQTLREVKRAAGFGQKNPWPVDCLRHSYASHWLPVHHNRAELAEILGNSPNIIRKHYRRAILPEVAEEYWTLPGAKIVEFKQPEVASG